jgi:PKD repeat protein
MRNLLANSFKICLFVFMILVSTKSTAQNSPDLSNCYGNCNSGDFTITRAFLTDINGSPILASACNTPGAVVDAYLSFTFTNTTNSDRNGIFISGTINGTFIAKCFPGVLPKKSSTTYTDVSHVVQWQCGTDLTLTGTFCGWGSAGENVCDLACGAVTPSKCRVLGNLTIQTPLSNSFTSSASCVAGQAFQTVAFTGTKSGGNGTITYDWDFGDATTHGTTQSPTHNYTSAGSFTVVFKVTDAGGATATTSASVSVASCCTAPTITDDPDDQTKCEGESASFSVSSSGGSPTPTIQWQVSTDGGSTYGNLNGETGSTLTINPVTLGMNGNKYLAVLTSGACTPVNSGAATLTVNAIPPVPSATYHPPACDEATFSVEVTNVVNGATYTIKKGDGSNFGVGVITPSDAITATSTANITFSGIPAGSGYEVSVSKNDCSPAGGALACGAEDRLAEQSRKAPATVNLNVEAQTTVKAYPNPFSDRIKFVVTSAVAGNGVLDVYNMTGQKVKTVHQGYIAAGTQTFELSLPTQQVANLVYVLRIGDKRMSGKILQINK